MSISKNAPRKFNSIFTDSSSSHEVEASIKVGGVLQSMELYTCQKESQLMVLSQISNFVQFEKWSTLDERSTHSVIFASVCGTRVMHCIGWTQEGMALAGTFNRFRERADGRDGTPAALKESTHLYDTVYSLPTNSVRL